MFAPPIDKTKGAGVKSYHGVRNNEIIKGRRREWPQRSKQLCRRNWAGMTFAGVALAGNTNTAI